MATIRYSHSTAVDPAQPRIFVAKQKKILKTIVTTTNDEFGQRLTQDNANLPDCHRSPTAKRQNLTFSQGGNCSRLMSYDELLYAQDLRTAPPP